MILVKTTNELDVLFNQLAKDSVDDDNVNYIQDWNSITECIYNEDINDITCSTIALLESSSDINTGD
jgi:hypothetical protein